MIHSRLYAQFVGASLFGAVAAFVGAQVLPACNASGREHSQRSATSSREESREQEEQDEDSSGEEAVDVSKLPEPVRAAAKKYFADLQGCKASRESEHGAQVFEVVGKGENGRDLSLNISSTGLVYEMEREVASDGLPPEVRAVLSRDFAGATVKKAETIEVHYFEIHLAKDGKRSEVRISGTGQVMEDEK